VTRSTVQWDGGGDGANVRPGRLVLVAGTGTDVGKTWVSCRLLERLRDDGVQVAARKPAQSFDVDADGAHDPTDAELLAAASGEDPFDVCPPHRWYGRAMAPPMAAAALELAPIGLDQLLGEITWRDGTEVGLVETAGGVRSPIADDGDAADLAARLEPDIVVLVADAELGVINAVRSTAGAFPAMPVAVFLNRYEAGNDLHRRNREWLTHRDGFTVCTSLEELERELLQK
jgi:dethiobiotin synthetase